MRLTQHDIGGEIISILTKGMYADPKDALREYVQNGIDANAESISIKIRQNNIVVQDNGHGMDGIVMRKAIRLGISDKNPKNHVGFMGIGLYSSFHLCDKLTIYSKIKKSFPNKLVFDFKKMRELLEKQKEDRIQDSKKEIEQIALLSLLQANIQLTELHNDDFPKTGTRVELSGLEDTFFKTLAKFDEVSEYLEKVVPLPFRSDFSPGVEIEKHIEERCAEHNARFRLIDLTLQIDSTSQKLFRPYKDSDFNGGPLKPKFYDVKSDSQFFGVAWACLNGANEVIKNEKIRGFVIKKHGFTIGDRNLLLSRFTSKFFNRSVGELIVIHPLLLPNAARADFEYSNFRTIFYAAVDKLVDEFNDYANKQQEKEKAQVELYKLINLYKDLKSQVTAISGDSDKLLDFHRRLFKANSDFKKRYKFSWKIKPEIKKDAQEIIGLVDGLIKEINSLILAKTSYRKKSSKTREQLELELEKSPSAQDYHEPTPKSLIEVIELNGLPFNEEIRKIFELIDDQFIKPNSKNEEDYRNILLKLKNDIDDLLLES